MGQAEKVACHVLNICRGLDQIDPVPSQRRTCEAGRLQAITLTISSPDALL